MPPESTEGKTKMKYAEKETPQERKADAIRYKLQNEFCSSSDSSDDDTSEPRKKGKWMKPRKRKRLILECAQKLKKPWAK